MSENSGKINDAVDLIFEVRAIMRLSAFAVDNMPLAERLGQAEMVSALGRAAEAGMRLTLQAAALLDDLADDLRRAG